jgi:probable F420-dependent oxidoreductase
MQLGLNLPVVDPGVGPGELASLTTAAEELGYSHVYLGEHVVLFDEQADAYLGARGRSVPFPPEANLPEPLTALAFLAAVTSTIRLATGVIVLPQRNPVYAAKQAATVDWLSGGRLDLTVGIGWSELEFAATGTPWARRGARCDEYVTLLRALWAEGATTHDGEFYELATCYQYPKPVQRPGPPIWFGGTSDAAMRRVAEIGDGWYVFDFTPELLKDRLSVLQEMLAGHGRSLDEITVVLGVNRLAPTTRVDVRAYADAGVAQLVYSVPAGPTEDQVARLQHVADLVLT